MMKPIMDAISHLFFTACAALVLRWLFLCAKYSPIMDPTTGNKSGRIRYNIQEPFAIVTLNSQLSDSSCPQTDSSRG